MNPEAAKRLRLLASTASVLLLLAVVLAAWFYWRVRVSLPQLDGVAHVAGLAAPVTITRDGLGVPTIRARDRAEAARALGWLHGQERFFQMDLLRRVPAGELSEMFGKRALPRDRATRMHGFRKLAQTVVARMPAEQRMVLEAYTGGVNAGVAALKERPFEYLVLREPPVAWRPEDSILVIYAMTLDLQDEEGVYERTLMTLRDELGLEALAFFAPTMTPNDAALDGTKAPLAPMPGPKAIDLRLKKIGARQNKTPVKSLAGIYGAAAERDPKTEEEAWRFFPFEPGDREFARGSNAFALAGAHTASGAAMLADDMHLDHGVPNIWYRASLEYGGRKVTGVTLPGTPAVVAGSNGSVAWGFTSAYVDTVDLVVVEVNSIAPHLYKSPDREDSLSIEQRKETIRIKGEKAEEMEYPWTIWGPIVGTDDRRRPLAHRWVAHDPATTDLGLMAIENATNVTEAIAVAHNAGMPAQNILLADKAGAIAWTIAGHVPKRVGYDGRLPTSWGFGDRKWDGYLSPAQVPVVTGENAVLPGRLWSANNRHVGGDGLAKLGDGAYRRAPRAAQIRDDLAVLERATPKDLLAVQLDDRALFLKRWHELLMNVLTPEVVAQTKARAALRSFAEKWEGRASVDAVSYRLVREFRTAVFARVFPPFFQPCVEAFPRFDARDLQLEDPFWVMLREKPLHLLNPEFASWDALLVAAADDVIKTTDQEGVRLPQANWGWRNKARIRHPFSISLWWVGRWLNMPADPLNGDTDMPRVQSPGHGASERLVVSPGRENEGIFHMPGGQSGHPLSPYYRAGHEAWVRGEATPFLPGKTAHTLTLEP
jgi:penicillin G amidase